MSSGKSTVIRFRQAGPLAIAAGVATLGALPMAAGSPWLLLIALIPLTVAVWAARAGTAAGPDGLRVRALLGTRHIPWPAVAGIAPGASGRVFALLTDGTTMRLPGVPPRAVTDLLEAGGQTLADDDHSV